MRPHRPGRPRRFRASVIVVAILTALSLLLSACSSHHDTKSTHATVDAKGGTLHGNAGDQPVTIDVPAGGATDNTKVDFRPQPDDHGQGISHLGVIPLGKPVDVAVTHGKLTRGRITLSYDPKDLPNKATATNVGIMVFDNKLGAWFPLLDATADPKTHQVSGTAPHFSKFRKYVIKPGKNLLHVAGRTLTIIADANTRANDFFKEAIKLSAVSFVKDLFAIPEKLKCDEPSTTVTAKAYTAIGDDNLFGACTDGNGKNVSLKMRNGAAYPVLLDPLPKGVTVSALDVAHSDDTATLIRNLYWMSKGRRVIAGAQLGTVTVNQNLTNTATLHGHMDVTAVAEDMLMAALLVFLPAMEASKALDSLIVEATATAAAKTGGDGLATATTAAIKAGPQTKAPDDFAENLGTIIDGGDCILASKNITSEAGSFKKHLTAAVKAAQVCGKQVLAQLDGAKMIQSLLSVLKTVPELIQAQIAGISNFVTGGRDHLTSTYVDLARVHLDLSGLTGKWFSDTDQMTIKSDGTGIDYYNPPPGSDYALQPCNSTSQGCYTRLSITKTSLFSDPANAVATITAANTEALGRVGDTLYLTFVTDDGRAIEVRNNSRTSGTNVITDYCRLEVKQACAGSQIGAPPD